MQRLEKEKDRLSSELDDVLFKLEDLERAYRTNATKMKDLEAKLKTSSTDSENFESERRAWKENEREAETTRALLEQKLLQIDGKFKTADMERKELKGKVFAFQDEISDLEFKLEIKTSDCTSLEAQLKILSEKYEKSLSENSRIRSELKESKASLESAVRDLSDKEEEVKLLQDTKTRVEHEMASLKETMFSDRDSARQEPQIQERLQKDLLQAHKMISELDVRVKKAETGESRVREELRRKNDKLNGMEIELDEVKDCLEVNHKVKPFDWIRLSCVFRLSA